MEMFPVICRITALIGVALLCLPASPRYFAVRGEATESLQLNKRAVAAPGDTGIKTCTQDPVSLSLEGDKGSFQFKCGPGLKLYPVEKADSPGKSLTDEERKQVYLFSATERGHKCGDSGSTLDALVPGSTLEVVTEAGKRAAQQQLVGESQFRLSLVAPVENDQRFCYICTDPQTENHSGRAANCTIDVKVPKKKEPEKPTGPQLPTDPETDGQGDHPPESGAISPPVFRWLTLGVAACALGLMSLL